MEIFSFLNDRKLMAGWGKTGNDEAVAGRYAYLSGVTSGGSYSVGSGAGDAVGNYVIASSIRDFPNDDLRWETVTQTYVGFDASFLNNRLTATVEYFNRVT